MQLAGESERSRMMTETETDVGLYIVLYGWERLEAQGKRVAHRGRRRRALHPG